MSDFGVSQSNSQGASLIQSTVNYNESANAHNQEVMRNLTNQKKANDTSRTEDKYFYLLDSGYALNNARKVGLNTYKNYTGTGSPETAISDADKTAKASATSIRNTAANTAETTAAKTATTTETVSSEAASVASKGSKIAGEADEVSEAASVASKAGTALKGAASGASKVVGIASAGEAIYSDAEGGFSKDDTAGKVANVAAIASGILDVAAFVPGLDVVAAPLAAISGAVGAVAGGIEARNQLTKSDASNTASAKSQQIKLQTAHQYSQMGLIASQNTSSTDSIRGSSSF